MLKYRNFSFSKVFSESGFAKSFSLPDDCSKMIGVFVLPQLPDMEAPDNQPFLIGKVSILLNNKTENSLHDYPIMAYPDTGGKMSLGNDFVFENKHIELNTLIEKGNVVTFVYKDSGYMVPFIAADPVKYDSYNPDLDIYLVYEDDRGDWSNNQYDKRLRLLIEEE